MKPYFETQLGKLYHGDCMEVLLGLPDFDLAIVDPPYGLKGVTSTRKNLSRSKAAQATDYGEIDWDNKIPPPEYFDLLRTRSRNQIIFGGNYFAHLLLPSPCWIVWDKDNTGSFADCELAWSSFPTAVRNFRYRWNGMIQENAAKKEKRVHPYQKPVGLYKQLLDFYAKPGQTILDTHAGSGPTALACEELGLKWVCIEREEQYCEIIARRVERENQQLKLFAGRCG